MCLYHDNKMHATRLVMARNEAPLSVASQRTFIILVTILRINNGTRRMRLYHDNKMHATRLVMARNEATSELCQSMDLYYF